MKDLWRGIGIVALLVALLVFLLLRSASPDLQLRKSMQEQLQRFELRDAELSRDALLARAGLLPNYDALMRDRAELLGAMESLRQLRGSGTPAAMKVLGPSIDLLAKALDDKLRDIENFKTDDALLRNSVAYLTYTIAKLDAQGSLRASNAAEVGELSGSFLRFLQTPNTGNGEQFMAAVDKLADKRAEDEDLHVLVAHGELVADHLPEVVARLRRIVGAPTTARVSELQGDIERYASEAESQAQVFRYLLFAVSLVLLSYLVRQFVKLRSSTRQLRQSNTELSREIGERQQAESDLRESEERYRAITESAHDAIISVDREGRIVSWNQAAQAIYGHRADQILGAPLARLMPERDHASAPLVAAAADAQTSPLVGRTLEATGLRRDGSEFPLEATIGSWQTAQGSFVTAIIRDISERRRLEETARQQELKLVQTNKMTALGTLVSGVAHEINNPNQLVMLNSSVLADTWRDACRVLDRHQETDGEFNLAGLPYTEMREAAATLIRDLNEGAVRIDRIVQDLKDFARPQRQGLQLEVDLNDVVQRAVRLLTHLIHKRTAHFTLDLAEHLPAVRGDAQQLEQVVVNLIVNALEALPDPARGVTVRTRADASSGSVRVEVQDQGTGIAPEHLQRLCDPFFTTKQDSGGTGLGLSVTFSIVQSHGGRLDFACPAEGGTHASVALPVAADPTNPEDRTP